MNGSRRAFLISGLMLSAAGIGNAAKPRLLAVRPEDRLQLEALVPTQFQEWGVDTAAVPILPDASVQAKLKALYDQTLARVYVDPDGWRFMLVIAYGGRQVDALRAHQPEYCYTAQGFTVRDLAADDIESPYGLIPARRLIAERGTRVELVVYWFSIGGRIANSGLGQKVEQVRAGLEGRIPEGFLVRASVIAPPEPRSYARLNRFLSFLLAALPAAGRRRIAGV